MRNVMGKAMAESYEYEKHYREGLIAGAEGVPISFNPYAGRFGAEERWDLGWEHGATGRTRDGTATASKGGTEAASSLPG